ncbi:hypothetical protein E4J89_02195 [Arthrobacter sp. CAU 1506]|uniref:hypothetical protein n=1 Tax=Arthrobacter sp. CAU 1506 TaxID=2560052 RepID=UPI0010ACBF33|nr:hypothetical protein [Arthrobacter sp. CAU 1506]TJY72508.1 hypothetical protein E4J89_02195 [Arthrobacter sp. CAU 1506]
MSPVSRKRKPKKPKNRQPGSGRQSGPESDPLLELYVELERPFADTLETASPIEAHSLGGYLLDLWDTQDDAGRQRRNELFYAWLDLAEDRNGPGAVPMLRALAFLIGRPEMRRDAETLADRLVADGFTEPEWAKHPVTVTALHRYADVYGDEANMLFEFTAGNEKVGLLALLDGNIFGGTVTETGLVDDPAATLKDLNEDAQEEGLVLDADADLTGTALDAWEGLDASLDLPEHMVDEDFGARRWVAQAWLRTIIELADETEDESEDWLSDEDYAELDDAEAGAAPSARPQHEDAQPAGGSLDGDIEALRQEQIDEMAARYVRETGRESASELGMVKQILGYSWDYDGGRFTRVSPVKLDLISETLLAEGGLEPVDPAELTAFLHRWVDWCAPREELSEHGVAALHQRLNGE